MNICAETKKIKLKREQYKGVKFKTVFMGGFFPNVQEKKIVADLIAAGKELGKLKMRDQNGGNLSARGPRGMIIKNTGAFPFKLKPKDFSLVIKAGKDAVYCYGFSEPSSESRLHFGIYKAYPKIKCVIHAHDFYAVCCQEVVKGVGYVKEISYGTMESAQAIRRIAKSYRYAIMKNHGVISFGRNAKEVINIIKKYNDRFKKMAS